MANPLRTIVGTIGLGLVLAGACEAGWLCYSVLIEPLRGFEDLVGNDTVSLAKGFGVGVAAIYFGMKLHEFGRNGGENMGRDSGMPLPSSPVPQARKSFKTVANAPVMVEQEQDEGRSKKKRRGAKASRDDDAFPESPREHDLAADPESVYASNTPQPRRLQPQPAPEPSYEQQPGYAEEQPAETYAEPEAQADPFADPYADMHQPEQPYEEPGYADHGYAPQGHAEQGYSEQGYAGQGYQNPGYPNQMDPNQVDPSQGYSQAPYPGQGYAPQQGFPGVPQQPAPPPAGYQPPQAGYTPPPPPRNQYFNYPPPPRVPGMAPPGPPAPPAPPQQQAPQQPAPPQPPVDDDARDAA